MTVCTMNFPSLDIPGFYFFRAKKQQIYMYKKVIYLFYIFPSFYSYFVLQNLLFCSGFK